MAFKDIQFPPAISFNATGGPMFLTDVVIKASGAEARNQNWSYERLSYEVSHAARREVDWRKLQAFFRIVAGRAYSFRFKDWTGSRSKPRPMPRSCCSIWPETDSVFPM